MHTKTPEPRSPSTPTSRAGKKESRMSIPKNVAATLHDTVNKVTTAVEEIHRSIADAPLEVMASIALERPVNEVRAIQDRSISAFYGLIRRVNNRAGQLTDELLPF